MKHFFSMRRAPVLWLPGERGPGNWLSPLISIPFLAGVLLGCVFGTFSESIPGYLSSIPFLAEAASEGGGSSALWLSFRYLFCALLLSASLFGPLLLPCLALLRGFLFSCTVAACFAARRYLGLADAALCIGIPALLELPVFLMISGSGIRFSLRLISAAGLEVRRSLPESRWKKRLLFLLPLLLLALLYRQLLLPQLVVQLF